MRGLLISILVLAVQSLALAQNEPPEANAGPDQNVFTGDSVVLEGTAVDHDGNPILSWGWVIVDVPEGSTWTLSNANGRIAFFSPYMAGDYVLSLRVSDAYYYSAPDYVTIHAHDNLPPVAIATADINTITIGGTVCFDGNQSYDPEGGPLNYDWDLGDYSSANTATVCHTYVYPGHYTVGFGVGDEHGGWDFEVLNITVFARPIAVATASTVSGPAPLAVQFGGSQSHGDTGRTLSFLWDFGDGNTSTDVSPAHVFSAGLYTVNLTVTDDLGGVGMTNLKLIAGHNGNWPPVADAGTFQWVDINTITFLNGSATDHDGQPILSWSWTVVWAPAGAQYSLANPADPHSAFTAQTPGTYILSLVVSDGIDTSLPDTVVVDVGIEEPPEANAGPDQNMYTGDRLVLQGTAIAPDHNPILSWGWVMVDVPAGSTWTLGSAQAPAAYFIPNTPGDYILSLRVSNAYYYSAPDYVTIHVADNLPPVAIPTATPSFGEAPLTVQFTANASDPNEDPLTYFWDFNDPLSADNNSSLENPTHIYAQKGIYRVALDVCDGLATINRSITIRAGIYGIDYLLGDIDFDGDVDFTDVNEFTSAYLSENGAPDYNSDADLNPNDGFIDLYDFALLANDWGKTLP